MKEQRALKLKAENESSKNEMLATMGVGLLHGIEMGYLSTNDAHAYMFNPLTVRIAKEAGIDSELVDLWNQTLFLEDLELMFSQERYNDELKRLKESMFEFLQRYTREKGKYHHWIEE